MLGGYTTCWAMCTSGARIENERTRRRRQLIRWGRQLEPVVSSGAAVGASSRRTCGRRSAASISPASTTTASLASVVRVQEDGGKAGAEQDGQDRRPNVVTRPLTTAQVKRSL